MALPHIQIGDNLIQDALLASVEVTQELNRHWLCTVVCRQTEDKRIPLEEFLGKSLEIKTTDDDGTEHTHFSGFVYDVELNYEVWGSYTAKFAAISFSYKMDVTAQKQYYPEQTLSSIATTVAGRSGLSIQVDGTKSKALNYVQYGETDFSFLHRIVDDYGCWLRPKDQGVEIADTFQAGSTVQWREENGLVSFRLRGTLAPATFSGAHYDHHAMQSNTFQGVGTAPSFYDSASRLTEAVQAASASTLPQGFEPQRARAMTLDDYQAQLTAESERSMGGAVIGTGESRDQALMAGNTIEIAGGIDAKGTYGLIKVVHHWQRTGYRNNFVCTPWKQYRNRQAPEARTWSGVVSARVVGHNDPKKMGRLQLQFFWQGTNSTHWARMVSPHAGPERGFMFMPEIGDEVAVAFEDGDPERPVVMGSLWNGVQTQDRRALRGDDVGDNDVKRLMTKSGNRVQFSDKKGYETVTMSTPRSSHIHLTETSDATNRALIVIETEGDIVLAAPDGRVHIIAKYFSRDINNKEDLEKAK